MKSDIRRALISSAALLVTITAFARAAGPVWEIIGLDQLSGNSSGAFGLSEQGMVGAELDADEVEQPVFWRANYSSTTPNMTVPLKLPSLGGRGGCAFRINESGLIVGKTKNVRGEFRPVLWRRGGGPGRFETTDLQTPDCPSGVAYAVNNASPLLGIVGVAQDRRGTWRAVVWEAVKDGSSVTPTFLPGIGGRNSYAYGINELGVIVGSAQTSHGVNHAVAWEKNLNTQRYECTDLDRNGSGSEARDVNSYNRAVGFFTTVDGKKHAFRTKVGDHVQPINPATDDLNTLGGANSWAADINEASDVVGWSEYSVLQSDVQAFYCSCDTPLVNLNERFTPSRAGWTLTHARAVAETGNHAIAVSGFNPVGHSSAALLTVLLASGSEVRAAPKDNVAATANGGGRINAGRNQIVGIGTISDGLAMRVNDIQTLTVRRPKADSPLTVQLTCSPAGSVSFEVITLQFPASSLEERRCFKVTAAPTSTTRSVTVRAQGGNIRQTTFNISP